MDKQKYEREIEEILQKFDKESGREPRANPANRPTAFRPTGRPQRPPLPTPGRSFNWKRLTAGQLLLAAFGVAVLAALIRGFSPGVASLLVLVAVALFIAPLFIYRSSGTTSGGWSAREEKRWRGQVIDFNTRRNVTNDPLAGLRRWWRRR